MISRKEATITLKKVWRIRDFYFYAEFYRPKFPNGSFIKPKQGENPYGFLRNFSINDRRVFYPRHEDFKFDRNLSFKIDLVDGLEDEKYYYVELELEDDHNRLENPFALKIKNIFILEEDHLPPKEFIRQWFFKKGHTPGDAATIASQLSLNELELYTHTKRFVFELIQNADDMPFGTNEVNINIQLLDNYLLFLHNGKFFDREDVKAISDAAKSTKSKNQTQIGYKGIGFKSVFTDSTRVFIKSGDYSFKFDKNEPIYKDFQALYSGYYEKLTQKAKREFELEFKGRENEFTNIDRIPWQIKPIWVEGNSYSDEIKKSEFVRNYQVAIALDIGESIINQKDYHGMISGLLKEARFLLFLRNTRSLEYKLIRNSSEQNDFNIIVSVRKQINNLQVLVNDVQVSSYLKNDFVVDITNEDFLKTGLNFKKRQLENGKYEFIDSEGQKLQNIPEKLGMLDSTVITLAAKVEKDQLIKLADEDSILFNYLPTSDQRFGFPFLVNADFVSKTDREYIQIENKWNHYLFYHLGRICICWMSKLAQIKTVAKNESQYTYASTYLNLLPQKMLDENNEELASINSAFNRGLKEAVLNIPFIIDSEQELKKCDEIIIDDTGISEILGPQFFKLISGTIKNLPLKIIENHFLQKSYLNIEAYLSDELQKALFQSENQEFLSERLLQINDDKYWEFLVWLDRFSNSNEIGSNWLLNLPFIKTKTTVISIKQCLEKTDFIILTEKTNPIESILKTLGFELSMFSLDNDSLKYIKQVSLTIESYLQSEEKLYNHITGLNKFDSLSPNEKNTLITFCEALDDIGKAKYAKGLALFKKQRQPDVLKPLNSLISNKCNNVPIWLENFLIDKDEEDALLPLFQKDLLIEERILADLFCNAELFKEVIENINNNNVGEFYRYLLYLHSALPEDKKPDYSGSGIPWIYLENNSSFELHRNIYFPDSFAKLSKDKYQNVKLILEGLSGQNLPCYDALPLKAAFSLGSKNIQLPEFIVKSESFELMPMNDFLDWVYMNNEGTFLEKFIIIKEEEKYRLSPANGCKLYFTGDNSLVNYISNSRLNNVLQLFPAELHANDRSKIGLLEGQELLKYLIDNGLADVSIAEFIHKENDNKLTFQYLQQLVELKIDTTREYTAKDSEFLVLKMAVNNLLGNEELLKYFRSKIILDNHLLTERAVSDDIRFYPKSGVIELKIKLSDILESYKNSTYSITKIKNCFIDFRDDSNLYKIFKQENRSVSKILKELNELNLSCYNPEQTFFLSFYKFYNGENAINNKKLFSHDEVINPSQEENMHHFLDICLREDKGYTGFVEQGVIPDFNPVLMILDQDIALPSEHIPFWLKNWLLKSDTENKKDFIRKLGVHDSESPIVLYRKAILSGQVDAIDVNREAVKQDQLLINTLEWLAEKQNKNHFVLTREILQPLYKKLNIRNIVHNQLLFPYLKSCSVDSYGLTKPIHNNELHFLHEGWGKHKEAIFNHLSSKHLITDDVLPPGYRANWNVINQSYAEELDAKNLDQNSIPFKAGYYEEWQLKDRYPIFICPYSKLPYIVKYCSYEIAGFSNNYADSANQKFYVVKDREDAMLYDLEGVMTNQILDSLRSQKQKYFDKEREEARKIQFTEEESELWKKLFGNEIPQEFFQDLNLAACVSALLDYSSNGYDVSKAELNLNNSHSYAQIEPVFYNNSPDALTVMCRSAIGGVLYLTAQAWDRLVFNNIQLYVKTKRKQGNYHIFKDKKDVLAISDTRYQVFRVESESSVDSTDAILNGNFPKDKIWLILKMDKSNKYKSIFDGAIKRNEELQDYDDINIDEEGSY